MPLRSASLVFLLFAMVSPTKAGEDMKNPADEVAQRWEVVELDFDYSGDPIKRPFAVKFGATFEHSSGDRVTIPGFYNGGDQWLIRFCPEKLGTWSYTTFSSSPTLSGKTGRVTVVENTRTWQHGPIHISKTNPQRFVYADGTPYLLMAFELDWLFALDAETSEGIPRTRKLISEIARNGFNQIVMNVYAYDAPWGEKDKIRPEHNFAKPRVFPFGGTNAQPDYSTLNVQYFRRLDRVIEFLNQQQIAAHLMIYVWNKDVNWPDPESEADNRYFDYVIQRYQAYPNIVWDISKEALDYGRDDMGYITRRIDRLRRGDGHGRILTVHDYKYCSAFPGKVDFISIQEWEPYLYYRMVSIRNAHPRKPIFNIEHGGYEKTTYSIFDGAYTDPQTCLDRTYQCLFAGTYATYYWQNSSWYNVITDPFALPKDQQPHFHYYKHLTKLLGRFDFTTLKATQQTFSPPMLSNGKGQYLFYLPDHRTGINGRLDELKEKTVSIEWFDPLTGESIDGGSHAFDDATWLWFKRPAGITGATTIAILSIVQ